MSRAARGVAAAVAALCLAGAVPGATAALDLPVRAGAVRVPAQALQPAWAAEVVITGVADGDTASAQLGGQRVRLRLASIDAPEHGQPWGRRSEQSLRKFNWKKRVRIEWREVDRYGRLIVTMSVDGVDVGAEQVRHGMAWVFRRYSRDGALLDLEEQARAARRGLWTDPQPVPPWEWRRARRP